jgi:hypothetical protein
MECCCHKFHVNFNINSFMDLVIIEFFGEEMNSLIIEFFYFKYSISQCCLVIGGFRTYIDTRFPQNVGLCEKLLWKLYQVSNMWVGGLISKLWVYVGMGFLQDECYFLVVVFMENKLRNHLICHLGMCSFLCTTILYCQNNFFEKPSPFKSSHKNIILSWCLKVNGLFYGATNFFSATPFHLFDGAILFCTKF